MKRRKEGKRASKNEGSEVKGSNNEERGDGKERA